MPEPVYIDPMTHTSITPLAENSPCPSDAFGPQSRLDFWL